MLVCPLCNSSSMTPYVKGMYCFQDKVFNLVKCQDCKLVFVNPCPTSSELEAMYSKKYFESDYISGFCSTPYGESEDFFSKHDHRVLTDLKKYKPTGKFLEVGCAEGNFLKLARDWGWDVRGVEISKWASKQAGKRHNIEVIAGQLEDAKYPDESFDVVFLSHLLEHVPNPKKLLAEVYRITKPEGIIYVAVPIFVNSPYFRIMQLFSRYFSKILPIFSQISKTDGVKRPPYHLIEFHPPTFRRIIKEAEFELISERMYTLTPQVISEGKSLSIKIQAFLLNSLFKTLVFVIDTFQIRAPEIYIIARKRKTG